MGDRKHLQYAIIKYLEDEAKDMSEDQRESLEGILFLIQTALTWSSEGSI